LQGTVTLQDSASSKPQIVLLHGSSTPVTLSPAQLDFGRQKVGTTSAAKRVTLMNQTDTTVTLGYISIGGNDARDFSIASETCAVQLEARSSCTVTITFRPTRTGSRKAGTYVTLDGTPNPKPSILIGTGT